MPTGARRAILGVPESESAIASDSNEGKRFGRKKPLDGAPAPGRGRPSAAISGALPGELAAPRSTHCTFKSLAVLPGARRAGDRVGDPLGAPKSPFSPRIRVPPPSTWQVSPPRGRVRGRSGSRSAPSTPSRSFSKAFAPPRRGSRGPFCPRGSPSRSSSSSTTNKEGPSPSLGRPPTTSTTGREEIFRRSPTLETPNFVFGCIILGL